MDNLLYNLSVACEAATGQGVRGGRGLMEKEKFKGVKERWRDGVWIGDEGEDRRRRGQSLEASWQEWICPDRKPGPRPRLEPYLSLQNTSPISPSSPCLKKKKKITINPTPLLCLPVSNSSLVLTDRAPLHLTLLSLLFKQEIMHIHTLAILYCQ